MVDIGSGNGLLFNDTKPLTESMMTNRQLCFVAISREIFIYVLDIKKYSFEIAAAWLSVLNQRNKVIVTRVFAVFVNASLYVFIFYMKILGKFRNIWVQF